MPSDPDRHDERVEEARLALFQGLYDHRRESGRKTSGRRRVRLLNPQSSDAPDATTRRFALLEIE